MIKSVFYKPASIIFSTLLLLFPTGDAIYSTSAFFGLFYQPSEFLAQLQRIVAQWYKIVYENVKGWYF
jgi:hypothetical protein